MHDPKIVTDQLEAYCYAIMKGTGSKGCFIVVIDDGESSATARTEGLDNAGLELTRGISVSADNFIKNITENNMSLSINFDGHTKLVEEIFESEDESSIS